MKEDCRVFMLALIAFVLMVIGVCCSDDEQQTQPETITVVGSVEDVLSASSYKHEEIHTLVNDRVFLGNFKLTAYCGCYECSGQWGNGTATGTVAKENWTIAVDPDVIPYGTMVIIGNNIYCAEDCGGAIVGNKIDIYHKSHAEAVKFGIQYADVFILT